jgi:hypothetical protein
MAVNNTDSPYYYTMDTSRYVGSNDDANDNNSMYRSEVNESVGSKEGE